MGLGSVVKEVWGRVKGLDAARVDVERKTVEAPFAMGSLLMPYRSPGVVTALPKPTVANLRRLAEMPVTRRAINCIKDRIACMDWRIELKPGTVDAGDQGDRETRISALQQALEVPNGTDSFRTLIEQVIEDLLVMGCGAVEVENAGIREQGLGISQPAVQLYPVDGATIEVDPAWSGNAEEPRYRQVTGKLEGEAGGAFVPLLDDELMYVRLNPRTHTPFGLGKVEVAFEAITQFLQAGRYAGRVAGNGVVQYALWMKDRTPEQQERLTRWWQEDVEGSGRVPVLSSEEQPQVLRLAMGTDAELRLGWQEFLLAMIANAFDLPAMMLGVTHDVNRSTAGELADEAFQNAVVPLAKLLAEHITRDVIAKKLGWHDLRFVWSGLESRDEVGEVEMQTKLLAAGVLSVAEVRAMRGLALEV